MEFKYLLKPDSFLSDFYFIQYSTSYNDFRYNIKSNILYALCDENNNLIIDKNEHILCFEDILVCKTFCRNKLEGTLYSHVKTHINHIYALLIKHPSIGIIIKRHTGSTLRVPFL